MSLVQSPAMFNNHHHNASYQQGHLRSRSYNEMLTSFNASHSDLVKQSTEGLAFYDQKRSRTAPPSPPYEINNKFGPGSALSVSSSSTDKLITSNVIRPNPNLRSRSLSPSKKLPSISAALQSTKSSSIRLKPVITPPTVSLDYFDTYKPNDENWRYELLDTINKDSKYFHLNQYNYLNKYATSAKYQSQSQQHSINSISSKIANQRPSLPSVSSICHEKKINFPFESNYTYLNKTYMNDVEKYPEYLELAQSLIQLSQPPVTPPTSYSPNSSAAPPPTRLPIVKPSQYSHQTYTEAPVPVVYHQSGTITPPASRLPSIQANNHSPELVTLHHAPVQVQPLATPAAQQSHKFIPITPPSSKSKSRTELLKSPPKHHYNHHSPRVCISCGSDQSPCWRPSWSIKEGQLCNSCGLRYKKTSARCLNNNCKKIPAKGEWSLMQSKGKTMFDDGHDGYSCLECGWRVEIKT
ncbi:GATA-type transcription factor [Scheffersomyces stipitis CBS 6054]|uniref:GATA-type transcription factor n=1 Tax=Scheffersomyces stipitis (strain ATCC 58785 / CBS 6054 / NBRC 10063 / NRRL Y-11545) TaxID=322104 RepID=A3LZ39_PICST|nr:GATA-type transcription factor [Scheffersomyces stipitis CBS 6054]ABN68092.2 GATA-type transcription factor [Scheffersomyces stipitis CBS 6054]